MAKKKRVRKSKPVRKVMGTSSRNMTAMEETTVPYKRKINSIMGYFILFFIPFLISLVVYNILPFGLTSNLFWIIALITGFVSLALLISLLVFIFLNLMKR